MVTVHLGFFGFTSLIAIMWGFNSLFKLILLVP